MDPRYSRQLVLPGFGPQAQERLQKARVLVIGAGGLGSAVLPALAGAGVGTIGIIDDDRVELSNLHRQTIHRTDAVGSPKTESAAIAIHALNPTTEVMTSEHRLSARNALELFEQFDLVIDGSDNFPTRYLVSDAAVLTGRPVVWGAVSQYGGQASVAPPEGPTYRDLFPTPPPPGSVESCEVGGVLPTTVGVIGSIMAGEAIKVLTGVGTPLVGRVTTYDALSGGFRELAFERDPSATPVTELIDYEAFCGEVSTGDDPASTSISATELATLSGVSLLDVRQSWEAEIASLPGSILVPLRALPEVIEDLDHDAEWVVYCHLGIRSQQALELMQQHGFRHVRHLDGGIDAWAATVDPEMARY